MFRIEFFSIAVFVCKSKESKSEKRNKNSKPKEESRRLHRWRKSQVFQLDILIEDSSKT
jgi:hypothetical protein